MVKMKSLGSVLKTNNYKPDKVVYLDDDDVKAIQKRLLSVLDDIILVCNENRINYQMSGGSCLGAVRHKGYIPWDDDIDINIYRKDLKRFIKAFSSKFHDKYWIHVPGKTKGYDYLYVRILTKDIRARDVMDPEKVECGLCTDIFVVENTFDNSILRRIHGIGYMGFRYILSCIRFHKNKSELMEISGKNDELWKYIKKRVFFGRIFSIIPVSIWARLAFGWSGICKNRRSEYVTIPSGTKQFFGELYKRDKFAKSTRGKFEGRIVRISADYDIYLSKLYGDYMVIPPEGNRERHVMMELDREKLKPYYDERSKDGL